MHFILFSIVVQSTVAC